MDEWISPIDHHRHFGDAGRAECAVCCLEAERYRYEVALRLIAQPADAGCAACAAIAQHALDRSAEATDE